MLKDRKKVCIAFGLNYEDIQSRADADMDSIVNWFDWESSPEGYAFWSHLYNIQYDWPAFEDCYITEEGKRYVTNR